MHIFDKITTHFKDNKPFVVYRKPNDTLISGFFQKNDTLFFSNDLTESGFVFAPFDNREKSILIPENEADFYQEKLDLEAVTVDGNSIANPGNSSKDKHIQLVEKTIQKINNSDFKKVVISRKEIIPIEDFSITKVYKKLLARYKNAFGYVWFHPSVGLWLGATPETLLNISDDNFETMSLAGTQLFVDTENVVWQNKELEEQLLVTAFIENQLIPISSKLKIDKTETTKAGSLLHLKTKISGELKIQNLKLKTLIGALHPTPAVCGLPREKTNGFILENENYQRTFYTGFLGELNLKNKTTKAIESSLFVNLRCMEIEANQANLFIGGGITKESIAINEWEETVSKSKVMKAIL